VRGTARRAWLLALLAALLALAATAHAQDFYPVRAAVSAGEPERGKPLTLWVYVSATRSVSAIVKVATYVPGRGWGEGWVELWRGDLSAGETKTLTYTLYIPEDAKPGSIVAWVTVEFGAGNFYTYKDGERYYVPYDVVQVLGALPDPQVDALKRQVEQLRANYTALQLDYRNLRASYEALQKSYSELGARLGELEARNTALQQELSAVRSERDRLQGEVRAWTITAVVAGLAGLAAGAALASLRRKPS
jgi:hypothetical protein